ncbi:hypothetical protein C1280_07650 [Gemmata obscuriglobus]|uniref:Uncharacterized protein n=1 Tax=Gemmata obscuriglobus TaxID=114 RepID=A0A2Z3GZZ9_9BACT|nr:hypothetical protein C1280_07650 [Gemmata obscuriglobus]
MGFSRPLVGVHAERDVPDVGHEPDRRERVAFGRDFHRPLEGAPDGVGGGLDRALEQQPVQNVPAGRVQIAEFGRVHETFPGAQLVLNHL